MLALVGLQPALWLSTDNDIGSVDGGYPLLPPAGDVSVDSLACSLTSTITGTEDAYSRHSVSEGWGVSFVLVNGQVVRETEVEPPVRYCNVTGYARSPPRNFQIITYSPAVIRVPLIVPSQR